MNKPNPKVDGFIRKNKQWQDELQQLRKIVLDTPLTEDVKWRVPCYTFEGSNVVLFGAFKESAVLSFVKGALLKDPKKILLQPGENTQSARVLRFTNVQQIIDLQSTIKAYIHEAIELEKSGAKVNFKKIEEFAVPEELQTRFNQMPALKKAFTALTPGRQRAYILYISAAKQSKTRESRVEKHLKRILAGKGIDD